MSRRHLVLLLLMAIVLGACSSSSTTPASTSSVPPPPPASTASTAVAPMPASNVDRSGMGTVFIYRDRAFVGSMLRPTVMVDGKDLVNIGNGRVYTGYFMPGKYLFQMDDKKSGADLDVKAGETYYMRVEIVPGFWKGGGRLMMMDPKQGSYEIKQLTPVEAKEIPDKSHS
jgi:hypothetical protein